jgi:hypothetical protein
MMPAIESKPDSDITPPAPTAGAVSRPGLAAKLGEYFLRFVVVAIGIGIGLIAAVIIAFVTGWIQITC